MSQKFRIKSDKGLFVEVRLWGLVTPSTLAGLRSEVLPSLSPRERDVCEKALDAVEKLPLVSSSMDVFRFDPEFDPQLDDEYQRGKLRRGWASRPRATMESHGWMAPETAKGASSGEGIECSNAQKAGWMDIASVVSQMGWIDMMLRRAGLDPIAEKRYRGGKTAARRAKELKFEPIDDFCELASTESWMLFVRAGFLDDKGSVGPLGRARMFESAKAASKTANARGLSEWKVVKASVELKAMENFPGDSVPDKLAQAISMREAELIRQALQSASMESLKSRLAQLEAKLEPEAAGAPARRARL